MHQIHIRLHRHGPPTFHLTQWTRWLNRRPPISKSKEDGGVPVEPDSPKNLSGGAAAALEFDD